MRRRAAGDRASIRIGNRSINMKFLIGKIIIDRFPIRIDALAGDATRTYTVEGQMRHRFCILGVYCQ